MEWAHDSLMNDLASHLCDPRRLIWCDCPMGSAGSVRPDVFTLQKSYVQPSPRSYECKISRADYLSDTAGGKWHAYLRFSEAVIFAVPEGLVARTEVPAGCGLIVRYPSVWRTVIRAKPVPVELPTKVLLKLLIEGRERNHRSWRQRVFNEWTTQKKIQEKYGDRVAKILTDLGAAERLVKATEKDAAKIAERAASFSREETARANREAEDMLQMLAAAVGDPTLRGYELRQRVREVADRLKKDGEVQRLRQALDMVRETLERAAPLQLVACVSDNGEENDHESE